MDSTQWPLLIDKLPLSTDVVHVVSLNLQTEPAQAEALRRYLSPDELVRADRYKFEEPRRRFIACRAALRQILGAAINRQPEALRFDYGPHGKPRLVAGSASDSEIDFSVSHSADLALIAIAAGRRIGVDIEEQDPKVRILKLAHRFFSPKEAAELRSLPAEDQLAGFYRGWTGKEAYLKATGFGLSFPLSKFTVALHPHSAASLLEVVDQPEEAQRWRMCSLDVAAGFSAALLIEISVPPLPRIVQWSFTNANSLGGDRQ